MSESLAKQSKYPYGEDFQVRLLAIAYREPGFAERFSDVIDPDYFDNGDFKVLARVLKQYVVSHLRSPDLSMSRSLVISYCFDNGYESDVKERILETLNRVVTIDVFDPDWIKDKAFDFVKAQKLKDAILEGARLLEKGGADLQFDPVVQKITQALEFTRMGNESVVFREVAEHLPELVHLRSGLNVNRRFPSGIPALDADMFGGIGSKQLGLIMGPPKRGKTHVLVHLGAEALRHGFSVYHITIQDLSEWEVALRYAANLTHINSEVILRSEAIRDETYKNSVRLLLEGMSSNLVVSYFPSDSLTPAGLQSFLGSTISRTGIKPDLVILDYADLMSTGFKPTFNSAEKSEAMGWLYMQLMKMSSVFDFGLWTASQVQATSWSEDVIRASAAARSAKKIDHAHYVITLCQNDIERENNVIRLHEAAFRHGTDGNTITCIIDKAQSRLTQAEDFIPNSTPAISNASTTSETFDPLDVLSLL